MSEQLKNRLIALASKPFVVELDNWDILFGESPDTGYRWGESDGKISLARDICKELGIAFEIEKEEE